MQRVDVGGRIHSIRRRLALSQAGFAQRIGVTKVSVARYESGRVPRAEVLEKIAQLGRVSIAWVLTGDNESNIQTYTRFSPAVVDLLSLLEPDWSSKKWRGLSRRYRRRYEERARDVAIRAKRQLEEFRKFLEAELSVARLARDKSAR